MSSLASSLKQGWRVSYRGLPSSLLANSTPPDVFAFYFLNFRLAVFSPNWCWLSWHHLRQFIRSCATPPWATRGFMQLSPRHAAVLRKTFRHKCPSIKKSNIWINPLVFCHKAANRPAFIVKIDILEMWFSGDSGNMLTTAVSQLQINAANFPFCDTGSHVQCVWVCVSLQKHTHVYVCLYVWQGLVIYSSGAT